MPGRKINNHYDFPVYKFGWAVIDQGPKAVQKLFPKMKAKYPDDFSQETISRLSNVFINEKLYDEAIALYELNVRDYRKLVSMSKDTFIIEGVIYFRMKFEFDDQGRATKIIGILEWGNLDQSMRDK